MTQNRIVIGITGGSGSGKSVVSEAAKSLGFTHIDTDLIGHAVILKPQEAYYEIINEFGKSLLDAKGEIDRKKLASIVFGNEERLDKLNSIVHPKITKAVVSMLSERSVIDGAVLYKAPDLLKLCDYVIAVTNSDERRINFICRRDGITKEQALARIKSQPDNDFYSQNADFTIDSDCDVDGLMLKASKIIKRCISEKNS